MLAQLGRLSTPKRAAAPASGKEAVLLNPTGGKPEPGDDFVEDEDHPMTARHVAKPLQVLRIRRDRATPANAGRACGAPRVVGFPLDFGRPGGYQAASGDVASRTLGR